VNGSSKSPGKSCDILYNDSDANEGAIDSHDSPALCTHFEIDRMRNSIRPATREECTPTAPEHRGTTGSSAPMSQSRSTLTPFNFSNEVVIDIPVVSILLPNIVYGVSYDEGIDPAIWAW